MSRPDYRVVLSMLLTDEQREKYQTNAVFHALVDDMILTTIPALLLGLETKATAWLDGQRAHIEALREVSTPYIIPDELAKLLKPPQ